MLALTPAVLTVALALAGALMVLYIFAAPRRRPATLDLVRDARQQILAESLERQVSRSLATQLHNSLRRRLAAADLAWIKTPYFLLASIISALAGSLIASHLVSAPVFAILGAGGGAYVPWMTIDEAGERMRKRVDKQVVELLNLLEYAAASNRSATETFLEMAGFIKERPLSRHIEQARFSIDPREGLGGQSFITVLNALDKAIAHPWFHRAYRVLVIGQQRGTPIRESLAYAADDARQCMAEAIEGRVEYTQIRSQTLILYGMVGVVTLAQQMLIPDTLTQFYSSLIGTITAIGLTSLCVFSYRHIIGRERVVMSEARGDTV